MFPSFNQNARYEQLSDLEITLDVLLNIGAGLFIAAMP